MRYSLLAAAMLLMTGISAVAVNPQVEREQQVLLTIDNKPVTLGEFEYLYHKNNSQQLVPQTIDQYLDMFINYKLKVAEAEAAGIDTTATFRNEFEGYARELAQPYLIDKEVEQQLINKMYDRMQQEVNVSHIMMFTGQTDEQRKANFATLDSLRNVILNGGNFEEIAKIYSIDRASRDNGGNMGYITALRFPGTFEDAAYDTPLGQLSAVIETPYGYHLVKPLERRKARGQVLVQHILKLTQGKTPEEKAQIKAHMDSIHALLIAGSDFDTLAGSESEDPGSARQGGRLPWFSTGRMVKPFEEASFALADGEISDVIESPFGYHIIKRLDSKGIDSKEAMTPSIKEALSQDERGQLPRRARIDEFKKKYDVKINRPALAMVESVIRNKGGYDSTVIAQFQPMNAALVTLAGNQAVTLPQVVNATPAMPGVPAAQAYEIFTKNLDNLVDAAVINNAIDDMANENADYRNLLNEYRDGMLLFEISDRNIWTKAKEDTKGLDKWFNEHRKRYHWEAPKFKSYIIFATSDSVLKVAHDFLAANPIEGKDLAAAMRQLCGSDIRVERVIAAKGENAIVDYLGFNGENPKRTGKWAYFEAYQPKILEQPEEVADERGAVTTDYQTHLEEVWVKDMRSKHKVKVNKKVLKQAK